MTDLRAGLLTIGIPAPIDRGAAGVKIRAHGGVVSGYFRRPIVNEYRLWYIHVYPNRRGPVTTARTRTFRSGNSEAIRLPRDVAFGDDVELVVVRSGDVMTIYPAESTVPEMLARLRKLPAPPTVERRDEDDLPERTGI